MSTLYAYQLLLDVFRRPGHARAVDMIDSLLYIVPTLVVEQLDQSMKRQPSRSTAHKKGFKALLCLVKACAMALQFHLDDDDITEIQRYDSVYFAAIRLLTSP